MTNPITEVSRQEQWIKRFLLLLMYVVSGTFFLSIKIASVCVIVLFVGWFYLTLRSPEKHLFKFKANGVAIVLLLYFVMQLISLSYSANLREGMKNIETKLPILLFPLIFFSGYDLLKDIKVKKVLVVFSNSAVLVCFFILAKIASISSSMLDAWSQYTFEKLSGIASFHPGYLSLYLSFSIIILIIYFNSFSRLGKFWAGGQILLLSIFVFRLASRMPIVGLILAITIYFILMKQYKAIIVGLVLSIVLFALVKNKNSDIQERFVVPLTMASSGNFDSLKNYAYDRIQIYSCALEIIVSKTFFTGVGAGDVDEILIDCYDQHDFWWISSQRYNAHNEYLQSTIEIGIVGGLILVFLMIYPIKFWKEQPLFLLFTVLFGIFSLTESTLQVQKGVVFFSFFYTLFASFAGKYQLNHNE